MATKKTNPQRGYSMRIDISADEYKALRLMAIQRDTTTPKLIAEAIRQILKKK